MDAVAAPETTRNAPERPGLLGAFIAPAIVVLCVAGSWVMRPGPAQTLGAIADFALTDQAGRSVTRRDLDGHAWIADFVFTRCGGPCPTLSREVVEKRLESALAGTDARLVSVTVDPLNDTPPVLAEYAKVHHATDRWLFLTGDLGAVTSLVTDSFHLALRREPGAPIPQLVTHSTRLVLVDRVGQIRGYYEPLDEDMKVKDAEVARLTRDTRALGNGSRLPLLNAALNATSALLLLVGYALIRAGRTGAHATAMLSALAVSGLFLGCYLYYHYVYASTPFTGEGPARALYFAILIPHVLLAVPLVPLSVGSAVLGLRGRWDQHRRWARWAFPIWIYVSVTGVAVYALLYEIYRP